MSIHSPKLINPPHICYIDMTRGIRSINKLEQISIRLPLDLIDDLNKLKEKEQIDRSAIIVKALRYWVSVQGHVSEDNEYLNQIREIKTRQEEMKTQLDKMLMQYENEARENRALLAEQQKTINTLLRMIPKED